jgi:hypothetical protein
VTHFRFNDPSAVAGTIHDWLGMACKPLSASRIHLTILDTRTPTDETIRVNRFTDVPAARLQKVYRQGVPEKLHVVRDESYYRWRLDDPHREWEVYVATQNGSDLGAVITSQWDATDYTHLKIEDAVFVAEHADDVMPALLSRVITDNGGYAVVSVPDGVLPRRLLRRRTFVATDWPLFRTLYERAFTSLTLFANPVADIGADVTDPDRWLTSTLIRTTG